MSQEHKIMNDLRNELVDAYKLIRSLEKAYENSQKELLVLKIKISELTKGEK